jgi:hypothetical protein
MVKVLRDNDGTRTHLWSTLDLMENNTEGDTSEAVRLIPFEESVSGMLAGFWQVPDSGFVWTDAYRPLGKNGILDLDSPPDDLGPWLVAQGDRARRYPLLRRKGLLTEADHLADEPTPERILAFAGRWGDLGIGRTLVPAVRHPDGTVVHITGVMTSGESLAGWRLQLLAYADLRRLWRAVAIAAHPESWGPDRVREAGEYLGARIDWSTDGGCRYHSRIEAGGGWREWHDHIYRPADRDATGVARRLAGENTLEAARLHLHRKVNAEMRGKVSPSVLPYLGGVMRFFPESLLAAIWLLFAQELAGGAGKERECEHCRLPFPQRRRDQRFCGKNCQEASAYAHRRSVESP